VKRSQSEPECYGVKKLTQVIGREEKYFQKIPQNRNVTARPKIVEILDSGSSVLDDSKLISMSHSNSHVFDLTPEKEEDRLHLY
jgi:hypothetical protein